MAHTLVKILFDDDGEEVKEPAWHLLVTDRDGPRAFCTGEFLGDGESACIYEEKIVKRGVPCPKCKELLKSYRSIKL
jgi:hypothetical protein